MHPDLIEDNQTKLLTAFGPTNPIDIKSGVRQGDVLSPILYILFMNPLMIWLDKSKDPYRIGKDGYWAQAYADDTALVASTKKGIVERMKRVDEFMIHNNVKINEDKSTYHWRGDTLVKVTTRGKDLKQEGEAGLFTYLGWTTNLQLEWTEQIQILIQRFQRVVWSIMEEKKLQLNCRKFGVRSRNRTLATRGFQGLSLAVKTV